MSISYSNPLDFQTENSFLKKTGEEDYSKTLADQTKQIFSPQINQVLPHTLSSNRGAAEIIKREGLTSSKDILKREGITSSKDILKREGITSAAEIVQKETGIPSIPSDKIEVPDFLKKKEEEKDIKVPSEFGAPASTLENIQSAARSVYGRELTPEQLQRYSNDLSTGKLTQDNIAAALAYGAETTTEKARSNTLLGYNYHELDPVDQMTVQLEDQYNTIKAQSGYSYRYSDRLPTLFKNQAEALAKAGVESIYDVGVKTIEKDAPINVTKRGVYDDNGNFTGKFEYLKLVGYEGSGESAAPVFELLNPDELAKLKEVDQGEAGYSITTTTKVPAKVLINTKTGEPLQTGFREEGELRQYGGLDIWGGANLGKGLDLFGVQVTEDGQPMFVPIWQETSDRAQIGQILAALAAPFAPQIGAAATGLTGTAATVAGATLVSAGSQLISTGKINSGTLAVSAVASYVGSTAGFTGADIAADAAQLAGQGLSQSQIASTMAAAGVNQVTANIAAGLAVSGVSASVAPVITSSLINMGVYGLHAAVTGKDVSDALKNGAIAGVSGAVSVKVIDDLFGAENIRSIAKEFNLLPSQVRAIGIGSLSNAITGEATGRGNFFNILTTELISGGISTSAANKMVSFLDDNVDSKTKNFIGNTVKGAADIGIKAALNNKSVEETLKVYAPSIIADNITSATR